MRNTLLYIVTVLVWGSTWLAIEYQLGEVHLFASLAYRFAIAASLMWAYCLISRVPMTFSLKDHGFILLLALFNFSMNYALIYASQVYLTSAMTSIAFSTMLLMNIVNTYIFFGTKITARVYIGASVGILGIIALFWKDVREHTTSIETVSFDVGTTIGLALVLASALVASFGNMVSVRNSRAGMNVFAVNAWGMLYGTILLCLMVGISGAEFSFSTKPTYVISLLYLAIFGTVIGFGTYYVLLSDIGPEKASYVLVLFPAVAVILSTIFEGFVWSSSTFLGFALVLIGNAIILTPVEKLTLRRRGAV